jgi:hypothetical protein
MKRNKAMRIAIVLLALVLVSTMGMVGTLARYAETLDAVESNVVRAGLWRIGGTANVSLGAALRTYNDSANVDPLKASQYTPDGDRKMIVPGTLIKADQPFTIQNFSEVAVDLAITGLTLEGATAAFLAQLEFAIAAAGPYAGPGLTLAEINTWLTNNSAAILGAAATTTLAPKVGVTAPITPNLFIRWAFDDDSEVNADRTPTNVLDGSLIDTPIGKAQAAALLGPNVTPLAPCPDWDGDTCTASHAECNLGGRQASLGNNWQAGSPAIQSPNEFKISLTLTAQQVLPTAAP